MDICIVEECHQTCFFPKNSFQVCWGQTKTFNILKAISQKLSYQRMHVTGMYLQLVYGECIDRYIIRYTVIYRDIIYMYILAHLR